jgi:RNA polymerase sigma-70 factor (ECF subfamily)
VRHEPNLVSGGGPKPVLVGSVEVLVSRQSAETELNELFAACMPRLARTARRFIRNPQDSEDVLQDSLLSAFKNLDQFEGRSSFCTWMHSIVRNEATVHLRRPYVRRYFSIEDHRSQNGELLLESAANPEPNAEEAYAEKERSRILRQVLTTMPALYRAAIQVCDIEGLNCRDAAARLGLSRAGLKTRLHRARKLVVTKIQDACAPNAQASAKSRQAYSASTSNCQNKG